MIHLSIEIYSRLLFNLRETEDQQQLEKDYMHTRIEILAHKDDGRAHKVENLLQEVGINTHIRAIDVYTSENEAAKNQAFAQSLANPVTQKIDETPKEFDWALEIGFLPGVTDNVGNTASELLALSANDEEETKCYSSRLYLIDGDITRAQINELSEKIANKLIQRVTIKSKDE